MPPSFRFFAAGSLLKRQASELRDLVANGCSFATLFDPANGTWWLDCVNPSIEEVRALALALQLHPLTTEDILTQDPAQKVESFDNYYFVVYSPTETAYFCAVVAARGIVTICYCPDSRDAIEYAAVQTRLVQIKETRPNNSLDSDWIIGAIVDQITDGLSQKMQEVENEAAVIEESLFRNSRNADVPENLQRMALAREKTLGLVTLLQGKHSVLRTLAHRANQSHDVNTSNWDLGILLGSTRGHLAEAADRLNALEDMLTRNYVNMISIMRVRLVHSNSSMEGVVAIVTLFSVTMLPSHIISSIWAMNCAVPGMNSKKHDWFWSVVGAMIGATALCGLVSVWYYKKVLKGSTAERVMHPYKTITS